MSDNPLILAILLEQVEISLKTLDLPLNWNQLPTACNPANWDIWSPTKKADELALLRGRLLEAQRLKTRLSTAPFYARAAQRKAGDAYWIQRAASYCGTD